jgi:hypothetical protein
VAAAASASGKRVSTAKAARMLIAIAIETDVRVRLATRQLAKDMTAIPSWFPTPVPADR